MYNVVIVNNGIETIIHSPYVEGAKVLSGVIKKEINLVDSFYFSLHGKNPGFHLIRPLQTIIKVWNTRTQTYEFEGRILGPSKHMESSGLYSESYECEGELGYLHDSVQRHVEFRGTPLQLITAIVAYHNVQVEAYKQFQIGNVSLTNSTDYLYVYLSAEKSTFDVIKEKVIDKLGGELQIRKENGVRFLDVVERVGEDKDTEIRLSKNLVTMTCDVDPVQIITRLTPLGTHIESDKEEDTDASQARLTIESVNGGIPFIDDVSLIREFGIQGGSVVWDDVTLPTNLFSRGKTWLGSQKIAHVQYQIRAVDLFLIGLDLDSFEVGNSYPVKNPIMEIDERLRIIGKSLDITSPQDASLTIGDKLKTLHQYQRDLKQSAQHMVNLQRTVSKQVGKMNSLSKNFGEASQELQSLKEAVGDADVKEMERFVSNLENQLQEIEGQIQGLPTIETIATIQRDIENHTQSMTDIQVKIEPMEQTIETNKNNLETVKTDVQSLEERVKKLEEGGIRRG